MRTHHHHHHNAWLNQKLDVCLLVTSIFAQRQTPADVASTPNAAEAKKSFHRMKMEELTAHGCLQERHDGGERLLEKKICDI
jgi:hypothetical protein